VCQCKQASGGSRLPSFPSSRMGWAALNSKQLSYLAPSAPFLQRSVRALVAADQQHRPGTGNTHAGIAQGRGDTFPLRHHLDAPGDATVRVISPSPSKPGGGTAPSRGGYAESPTRAVSSPDRAAVDGGRVGPGPAWTVFRYCIFQTWRERERETRRRRGGWSSKGAGGYWEEWGPSGTGAWTNGRVTR
jgi:hypothetical protein